MAAPSLSASSHESHHPLLQRPPELLQLSRRPTSLATPPLSSPTKGSVLETEELSGRLVFKVQRPQKINNNDAMTSPINNDPEDSLVWSSGLMKEETHFGTGKGTNQSNLQVKAVAIKQLMRKLETRNMYHLSSLLDEDQLDKIVKALDSKDRPEIQIIIDGFVQLLQCCIAENEQKEGCVLYDLAIECGIDSDPFLGTKFIRAFTHFGNLREAKKVFSKISKLDIFSWNAIIVAHAKLGRLDNVINLYHEMCSSSVQPNRYVLISVMKACCMQGDVNNVMKIHTDIIFRGSESRIFLGSALIDSYVKCHRLEEALSVFRSLPFQNIVTWTALISGHALQQHSKEALEHFLQMQGGGFQPNTVTFVSALKACSDLRDYELGNLIHCQIIENGLEKDIVISSSIADLYAKSGRFNDARAVFDRMKNVDVIAWSSLISRYAQYGQCEEALQLFWRMLEKGFVPDYVALATVLQFCPSIAAFEQGKLVHMQIIKAGFESELPIGSALIFFYGKFGELEDACAVFQQLPRRSILTWNTMVLSCALNSSFTLALKYFNEMHHVGMEPTGMLFFSLLSACNVSGLLDEACFYFKLMRETDDIFVTMDHFYILVELLGKLSHLDMAEDLLESIPFQLDDKGWMILLNACHIQGACNLGRRCFDYISQKSINNTANVIMSNIYERAGKENEANELRQFVSKPERGHSKAFIEVEMKVHTFTNGDLAHPQRDRILLKLNTLTRGMKNEFNIPVSDISSLRNKIKVEDVLCGHSEMLAVAFGLLNTPPGTTIRIAKDLGMCIECYNAMKIISKDEKRKIVISDVNRVHCFK